MTGRRGYATVKRGRRPDHEMLRKMGTLAQLEQLTRATYRGIPRVPDLAPIFDWRVCGCDYSTPIVDGKRVTQADDPAYQWSEEASDTLKSLAVEVRRLVLLYGLGYFHAKDAFRSFPGFPDATIWGAGTWIPAPGGAGVQLAGGPLEIVREMKPPHDAKFYGPQLATMTTMRLAGRDVGTWSSCCLLSGRISAELRAVAGGVAIHPEDVYGLAAPGAAPAVSGTRYDPGTIPTAPTAGPTGDTDLMSDGHPMGAARSSTPRARAAAAALLADLDAETVYGYVANPATAGLDQRAAADAVRKLAAWATDWGVNAAWPWRMVVDAGRYYVRDQRGRWAEVVRLSAGVDVVGVLKALNPRIVTAGSVPACQAMLAGRAPATEGAKP